MAIRLPLKTVASFTDANDTGTGSVGGAIMHTFTIPQDTDNIVLKMTASVSGCGVSAVLQTTDDGGTTYYDLARTSVVSNATNATAQWLSTPVAGIGVHTTAQQVASVGSHNYPVSVYGAIGNAQSLQVPAGAVTGLPVLSQTGRIAIVIAGDVTSAASNSITTEIKVNSQSATA